MKKITLFFALMLSGMILRGGTETQSTDPENLISREYFKQQLSWMNPARLWSCSAKPRTIEVRDEVFTMTSTKGFIQSIIPLNIGYETADRFRLTFEYQLSGKGYAAANHLNNLKKLLKSNISFPLEPTVEWKKFDRTFKRVPESDVLHLTFALSKKGSKLKLKNLRLTGIEPLKSSSESVILAGKEANGIYYLKGDFHAWHSAKILRSQLWRIKNIVLPLKACDQSELNAVKDGIIFTTNDSNKIGKGGFELKITPGKAVIESGKFSGLELGAVKLLRCLGIEYLTAYVYTVPEKLKADPCTVSVTPAVPLRFTDRPLPMPELLGYSNPVLIDNLRKVGALFRFAVHSAPLYLPFDEFSKTHPEYYALQADGKRLRRIPGEHFDVHFCMSNPEARQIIASRMIELIKSEPRAKIAQIFPGDGGGKYCRCESCMKMGENLGERNIAWVNEIAKLIEKECPDVKVATFSYVDSRFPPKKVFPRKNVIVQYCPYEPVWMNHLINEHPDNKQGIADLKEWEKKCPGQMAAFDYPNSCRETLNIWPAFYANYARFKHFAEQNYFSLFYCGFNSTYGSGSIQAKSFDDLSLYVFSKVLIDPKTDVEKAIDHFMKLYYGPAAPYMRAYFDLAHKEVVDRQWSQNTERIKRGFVTKPFAEKCYALFKKAEEASKGTVYYDRVRQDKLHLLWSDLSDNCRGNGKISRAKLPCYAEKLAEFCKICKQYGRTHNSIPYTSWFWDTAILRIKNRNIFYNDPMIKKLMEDPLNTLLNSVPDVQKKTSYGYYIENAGLLGGERIKSSWLSNKPFWATCLRRPSSGFGVAQFTLKLDQVPQNAELEILGVDNEKKDPALMKIEINGTKIYDGKVPWGKDDWTGQKFPIPANLLRTGENEVVIFNTTPDTEVDGEGGVNYTAKRNYFWGWFMIRDVKIILK